MDRTHGSWLAVLACLWACGGEADTGASAATSAASTSTNSSTNSSAASGGHAGSGGAATTSSAGGMGGGGSCPDITCTTPCPGGTWPELDGCPSCACAAQLELVVNGQPQDTQHLTLSVVASEFIGGIDRWVFAFTWNWDDPQASDDQQVVESTVRLMKVGPQFEPGEANATYFYPADSGNPLEIVDSNYTLYGFGVIMSQLDRVGGFFSIRRVGDTFEGHVSLDFTSTTTPATLRASGPFTAPVP